MQAPKPYVIKYACLCKHMQPRQTHLLGGGEGRLSHPLGQGLEA